jgi:D-serine dehydratase
MFVDDKMLFTLLRDLAHDQGIIVETATGLLGPAAVAHDKTFVG